MLHLVSHLPEGKFLFHCLCVCATFGELQRALGKADIVGELDCLVGSP